ncbi:putative universal stress protein A [Helianthus annuus]|nr:putative universal stress protein A [Helianthus annuus]
MIWMLYKSHAKQYTWSFVVSVKVDMRVDITDMRDVIYNVAVKMGVDMVVLGSHGYGLIKRQVLYFRARIGYISL